MKVRPFEAGNGRVGRVRFQGHLYAAGLPVLPWSFAFESRRDDYVSSLDNSLGKKSYEPFVKFILQASELALSKGQAMIPTLALERDQLMTELSSGTDMYLDDVRLYAEAALGGLLMEGFWGGRGIHNRRPALKRLHAAGLIDRIRTPIGAVYSAHCCRELLKVATIGV